MIDRLHLQQHPGLAPPSFEATVRAVEDGALVLDRTGFHPLGGGQPPDRGTLSTVNGVLAVTDVRGRSEVAHHVAAPADLELTSLIGTSVTGTIDAAWRDRMCRMHTSQHVISAVADELWSGVTAGNQIGPEMTRIDLRFPDRDTFDAEQCIEVANELIAERRAVQANERLRADLVADPLVRISLERMPPGVDRLRVIEIDDLDTCPCAGTHVGRTDEIGQLTLTRTRSKGKGMLRLAYHITH